MFSRYNLYISVLVAVGLKYLNGDYLLLENPYRLETQTKKEIHMGLQIKQE